MHKARELSLYGAKVGHAALVKNSRVRTTLASQSVPVRAFWNAKPSEEVLDHVRHEISHHGSYVEFVSAT
jgi:hypothetical protein